MPRDYKIPVLYEGEGATVANPVENYFGVAQREDAPGVNPDFDLATLGWLVPEVLYTLPDAAYVYRTQTADNKADVFNPLLALNRPLRLDRDGAKTLRVYAELGGGGATGGADDGAGPVDKSDNPLFPNWTKLVECPVWVLFDFNPPSSMTL